MSKPVTLNVRIRGALGDFVMAHVGAEGSYENVSEYVRDLIRRDKERLKPSSLVASRQSLRRHSMRRRAAGRNLCLYATAGARPKADAYIRGLFDCFDRLARRETRWRTIPAEFGIAGFWMGRASCGDRVGKSELFSEVGGSFTQKRQHIK